MAIIVDNKFNELHNEVGVVPLTQLINYGYPSKELGDLLGKEPITLVGLYKKETVIFYANRDYLVELGEYIGDKSKKDILFFRDLYKKSEELKKETVDILHKLGRQEISKYSNEEIINFINKLTKNGFVMSILSLVGAIADHVHDIFYNLMDFTIANAKNINKAKLNKIEILNLLTTPIWLMPSEKAKLELIKIKRVKDGKKQDLAIKNFLDKWHWLYHGHLGPGMTKKDVKEELEGDIKVEDK